MGPDCDRSTGFKRRCFSPTPMGELVNTIDASSTACMYFSMSCQCLATACHQAIFFFQIFVINVVRYSRERPWSQASFLPANPITDYQSIMDHEYSQLSLVISSLNLMNLMFNKEVTIHGGFSRMLETSKDSVKRGKKSAAQFREILRT